MIWPAAFWANVALIAYVLLGFPALVLLRAVLRPVRVEPALDGAWPSLTVVLAARNEAECIGTTLRRLLDQDYPGPLEVVVASDASEDGTDDVVRGIADPRLRLLRVERTPGRPGGKASALNAAVSVARGDVLVFTDANTWLADGALRAIARPFADQRVGGVAGDQRYRRGDDADHRADGERTYWNLERILKWGESRAGSTVSATGALYAVRRELVEPVPPDVTDDFFISTGVIAAGRRLVFEPEAVAIEPAAPTVGLEYSRKVRIITRGLTGVRRRAALLDPRRSGFYALQLLSHKVLRRLLALPLLGTFATLVPLARRRPRYRILLVLESGFAAAGIGGLLAHRRPLGRRRLLALPAYACMLQAAALRATWNVVRGRSITRWEPPTR